jgi:putative flippase GtrA
MNAALESLMPDDAGRTFGRGPLGDLVAFVLVGGGGLVAYVLLTTALMAMVPAWPRWAIGAGCYAGLILPVYLMHRRFSFQSDARYQVALPRYVAVQTVAVGLAALFSWLFFSVFGVPSFFGSVLVIGLISAVNFVVLRLWAFAGGDAVAAGRDAVAVASPN